MAAVVEGEVGEADLITRGKYIFCGSSTTLTSAVPLTEAMTTSLAMAETSL
jgi:hypothetical protein